MQICSFDIESAAQSLDFDPPMIPVTVLTGFLGSGKTTLLNRLVNERQSEGVAVIINEFGEIGLDHELIESSEENLTLLNNGCVCCSVRGDLIETLLDLADRQQAGRLAPLMHVIIETTGLADPAPIVHTLFTHERVKQVYELAGVITTVDAVNGLSTLARFPEARKQAAIADAILLTKVDLVDADTAASVCEALVRRNPAAALVDTSTGGFGTDELFSLSSRGKTSGETGIDRWLAADAVEAAEHAHDHHDCVDEGCTHSHHHHDDIKTFCITREEPITQARLDSWLALVTSMRGDDLLRVKGLINVAENPDHPVVIHGVQHVFHPPVTLARWPSDDRRTRIVFITRGIDKDVIETTLRVFTRRAKRLD